MWTYNPRTKQRYFVPLADADATTTTVALGAVEHHHGENTDHVFTGVGGGPPLTLGAWVESTGAASMNNGSIVAWDHDFDASLAYPELGLATDRYATCGVCRDNDGHIITTGMAMAWVIRPIKRTLELDGLYNMYVNGLQVHDVVIMRTTPTSRSFVVVATKDDAGLLMKRRLDALTIDV
jgi:hypothetical protein